VTDEQIERYQIGYALPTWRDLAAKFEGDWSCDAQILGLVKHGRRGNLYDHFRDRVMLPYCEPARDGRPATISGFAGRTRSKDPRAPKWLNSDNTEGVWTKSSALLGLYQAQARACELERVVVTEGGLDTLAFDRAEVPSVALVSVALSLAHCEVLADVCGVKALTIALDGDPSGRSSALTAAATALSFGFDYEAVTLIDPGDGQDPDDLTAEELREAWERPLSIVDFGLKFGEFASVSKRVALVAVLSPEHAEPLIAAWDLKAEVLERHRLRRSVDTPAGRLVAALETDPSLAGALARAEVDEVLAGEPLLYRRVATFGFAEATVEEALPPVVLRDWLTCRLPFVQRQLTASSSGDPFAEGDTHEAFKAWFARNEVLRVSVARMQKRLAELKNAK
jgi:DNA primase